MFEYKMEKSNKLVSVMAGMALIISVVALVLALTRDNSCSKDNYSSINESENNQCFGGPDKVCKTKDCKCLPQQDGNNSFCGCIYENYQFSCQNAKECTNCKYCSGDKNNCKCNNNGECENCPNEGESCENVKDCLKQQPETQPNLSQESYHTVDSRERGGSSGGISSWGGLLGNNSVVGKQCNLGHDNVDCANCSDPYCREVWESKFYCWDGDNTCQKKRDNGTKCREDGQCLGYCWEPKYGEKICKSRREQGEHCTRDGQCEAIPWIENEKKGKKGYWGQHCVKNKCMVDNYHP